MASIPNDIRVLFFDTFGTSVAQRGPVADELSRAAQDALAAEPSSISDEVRDKAKTMSYSDWDELGAEWNRENSTFVSSLIKQQGTVDWRAVDNDRITLLPTLLARRGLVSLRDNTIAPGSLFTSTQLDHLGKVWHRLTPWPDTVRGMELLNTRFSTVSLSNTYYDLLTGLIKHSGIPFQHAYSSDLFGSYKPNPKVYLGAAEKIGAKPEECALVAAHLSDLKGAKDCGFYAIYVQRPLEEKSPELKDQGIPDLVIEEDERGFIALAERLGVEVRGDRPTL